MAPREPVERKIMRDMLRCEWTLEQIALRANMKLEQLLEWSATSRGRGLMQAARYMEDIRVQLQVSQHRITALSRLVNLIKEKDWPAATRETLRRACAELLRLSVVSEPNASELEKTCARVAEEVDDAELLAALRYLGGGCGAGPDGPAASGESGVVEEEGGEG